MRLDLALRDTFRPPVQTRFGTVTSVSPGICQVQVAGGEIPVIHMKGAAPNVGDFVMVMRQGVVSYLPGVPGAPWAMGQTWPSINPATGTSYYLTQPFYVPAPLPSFAGSVQTALASGAAFSGFAAFGQETVWCYDSSLNLLGSWVVPGGEFQFVVGAIDPQTGVVTVFTQGPPTAYGKLPFPPILASAIDARNGELLAQAQPPIITPTGAPCFDPSNYNSSYSSGISFSQRDQVIYFLGQPGRDGFFFEWDALSLDTLEPVGYASGSALGPNLPVETSYGPNVGTVTIDQKTGYAWCLTQTYSQPTAISSIFVVDPKTGAIVSQPFTNSTLAPLVVNIDPAGRTVFVVAELEASVSTWYLMTFDADSGAQLGQYEFAGSNNYWSGSFTIGVDSVSGTAAFMLQEETSSGVLVGNFLVQWDRGCNLLRSVPFTESDVPLYFAMSQ